MRASNYNEQTLKFIRDQGYLIGRVEQYNAHSRKRMDLFGIIDYIAIGQGQIVGVQSTGYNGKSTHKNTITQSDLSYEWCANGGKLIVIAWRKKQIGRKLYHPDISIFTPSGFVQLDWQAPVNLALELDRQK